MAQRNKLHMQNLLVDQFIVGFGAFMGFSDSKKNTEYHQNKILCFNYSGSNFLNKKKQNNVLPPTRRTCHPVRRTLASAETAP